MIQKYADMFKLDEKTGIEISETDPNVTDSLPIPSSIGQGTNNYTTTQLARYMTTIANSGTVYNLSLLQKATDSDGNDIDMGAGLRSDGEFRNGCRFEHLGSCA